MSRCRPYAALADGEAAHRAEAAQVAPEVATRLLEEDDENVQVWFLAESARPCLAGLE